MKFLLLDLETTGLNPIRCQVLEVAARILEPGREIARYHSLVFAHGADSEVWEPVALQMHVDSGLYDQARGCEKSSADVDRELRQLIDDHVPEDDDLCLMGNSVHFDRAFMAVHMKKTRERLHYRQLDVTSVRLWHQLMNGGEDPYIELPKPHRAEEDIDNSLKQALYMWQHGR